MRILFVAPQPFYEDRGTPIAVHDTLGALSQLGFKVDVATYPIGSPISLPGIRMVRTANPLRFRWVAVGLSIRKILLDICLLMTVLRLARRNHYTCVHGVEEGAAIALFCKALYDMPVIYDMHSSLPEQLRGNRWFKHGLGRLMSLQVERWLVKNADYIIASRGLAPRILSMNHDKKVSECLFNGSGPRPFDDNLARILGVFKRPTVVYTGNFAPYQGLELLLDAASTVRVQIPKVVFLLVGGTEKELAHLSRSVESRGLQDNVKLCKRRPRHEIADYLSLADALVLPRKSGENAPLKIYDYMNSGKPTVATDIPAHKAVLSDQIAMMVAPERQALANGILKVLQDTKHARKIARSAGEFAQSCINKSFRETIAEAYSFVTQNQVPRSRESS